MAMKELDKVSLDNQVLLAQIELEKLKLIKDIELAKKGYRDVSKCPKGMVSRHQFVQKLKEHNIPLSTEFIEAVMHHYGPEVELFANCVKEKKLSDKVVRILIDSTKEGSYYVHKDSGIRFKADWLELSGYAASSRSLI